VTTTTNFQQEVEQNLPWNFSVNLIDISFITLGMSLISRETIMPLLVSQMTDSKIAIGLIPAIYSLGFYLPQLLMANYTERLKWKKPFVMLLGGLGERVPYLIIGLVIWALALGAPTLTLLLFFLLLATSAFTNGMATPAWFTLIGKVLPVNRRGIFFGISGGLGALMGIGGAYFVGKILDNQAYPNNFALLFAIAFLFMAISWVGLALNREPESPVVKQPVSLGSYLKQLPTVLRNHPNYRRFLLSYSTSKLGTMAIGFFLVYGNSSFNLTGAQVGLLTGVLVAGQALMNLIWGWVGDRSGHKIVLIGSAFALALATLIAWQASSITALIATFALVGAAIAGDDVSKFNIILEFTTPEEHPTFIGLTNTLLAPVVTLAPILGGWLATTWLGYQGMFVVAMTISTLGGLLLTIWVQEPRHVRPQIIKV
jgi:MFS family permease